MYMGSELVLPRGFKLHSPLKDGDEEIHGHFLDNRRSTRTPRDNEQVFLIYLGGEGTLTIQK